MNAQPKFKRGDIVRKTKGSQWRGKIVGEYSTELTPEGFNVESLFERGSVQLYPAAALEAVPEEESDVTSLLDRCLDALDRIEAIHNLDDSYNLGLLRTLLTNSMQTTLQQPDDLTSVPILLNFATNRLIGTLQVRTDQLPPTKDFVFSIGARMIGYGDAAPYELVCVSPVTDDEYIAYLRQVGKLPSVDDLMDAVRQRGSYTSNAEILRSLAQRKEGE